jgi:hypothetical protein
VNFDVMNYYFYKNYYINQHIIHFIFIIHLNNIIIFIFIISIIASSAINNLSISPIIPILHSFYYPAFYFTMIIMMILKNDLSENCLIMILLNLDSYIIIFDDNNGF